MESILGGVDWGNTFSPLLDVSPFMVIAFFAYIVFCLLAMINAITRIFVESALKKTEKTKYEAFATHAVPVQVA